MSTNNIGISKDVDDIISTLNNKFDNEKGLQLESELNTEVDRLESIIDSKLNKTGGGITGTLTFPVGCILSVNNEYAGLEINGNKDIPYEGSTFVARGPNAQEGPNCAVMIGRNKSQSTFLTVWPDSKLTLNGQNIVRSVNNVNADAAGNVDISAVTGSVTQIASRTTLGTWTITGVTVGKPLKILYSTTNTQNSISLRVTSGSSDGNCGFTDKSYWFVLGNSAWTIGSSMGTTFSGGTNIFEVIPTATSVVIEIGAFWNGTIKGTLRAYQ